MKVLMLNGSVNRDGNTQVALEEIAAELKSFGIESEIFPIGVKEIRDCIGFNKCRKKDASLKMISATLYCQGKRDRRIYLRISCLLRPSIWSALIFIDSGLLFFRICFCL